MQSVTVELRNVEGTGAAIGRAGAHTLVVDRPEGKAGGQGLGFNGAQLLALALGGCFCNDLRYTAEKMGVTITSIAVSVDLALEGEPLVATAAIMTVRCSIAGDGSATELIERAKAVCTVANSIRKGLPVSIHGLA